jgi:hypothetical protein
MGTEEALASILALKFLLPRLLEKVTSEETNC